MTPGAAWFDVDGMTVAYGSRSPVLRNVSLHMDAGEIVTMIGPNGAGKTTLLASISGLVPATCRRVSFEGEDLQGLTTRARVSRGIAHVPEGRELFPDMTVEENLTLGGYLRPRAEVASALQSVNERFPILAERRRQQAGRLSGGEQQMLAIGRALMSRPRLLLLDEPSIGLAPRVVEQIGQMIQDISTREGVGVLLVEQNAEVALNVAARAYVLELGRVVFSGDAASVRADKRVQDVYLAP